MRLSINYFGLTAFLVSNLLFSCKVKQGEERLALFSLLDSTSTGIGFINQIKDTKEFNIFSYRNFYNGGGVAIGDINNDSLPDIYLTSNMGSNRLFLNKGHFKFEDITATAGVAGKGDWSTGVAMADVNGDGLLDIYVCNSGDVDLEGRKNELFINQGNLTFVEQAETYGLDDNGFSTHASFFDYDLDGDLDCYILNNSFTHVDKILSVQLADGGRGVRQQEGGDKLLRNDGGKFIDVSEAAHIYGSGIGFGLGVSVSDVNNDMLPDIYVSNDFYERDYLYLNQGDGTFSEEISQRCSVISSSSMGSDVADLNNDGLVEIFTTDMLPGDNFRLKSMTRFDENNVKQARVAGGYHYQSMQNCLQLNSGNGNFQEIAALANVDATDWSWGALIFDMDNDGWKDIFVSNGIFKDITSMDFSDFISDRENVKKYVLKEGKYDYQDMLNQLPSTPVANYAFRNNGNLTFANMADSLGLGKPSFSNGAAYADLDNDGDMDLVINNVNTPCFVYRNNSEVFNKNNFIKVKLIGLDGNNFGIGAQAKIFFDGKNQVLQNYISRGFQSAVEPYLQFGLGQIKRIDSVEVIWPNKKRQVIQSPQINTTLYVRQSDAHENYTNARSSTMPWYEDVAAQILKGDYTHHENGFDDFNNERLLPRKLSTEGPNVLIGDLNGDGQDDFLILGAAGDPDKIFIQQKNGTFIQKKTALDVDAEYESTCAAIFDLDKDGDLDLLIGSGGNQIEKGDKFFACRYYENTGNATFNRNDKKLPSVVGELSCIRVEDFDRDGDVDLFYGARAVPGNYGLIPKSFLFRNDNSVWTDITPNSLAGAGMVTDAIWVDINQDSLADLVVVGEWMPIKIYSNKGDKLEEAHIVENTDGWWNTVCKADINKDGKEDLILGNWGLNTKFKAELKKPLKMYVKDFDGNGKSEFIITWYPPAENESYPFASKMDMTSQLPYLKKNALKYDQYAKMHYEDLFKTDVRKEALVFSASYLKSAVLINRGDFNLELKELPIEAQFAPVFSILAEDLDGDKKIDLLLGGNFYGLKPEVGKHDANRGVFLKGNDEGDFTFVSPEITGILLEGEVRDIVSIRTNRNRLILVGKNNSKLQAFVK